MRGITHPGRGTGQMRAIVRRTVSALTPAQALVADLLAYSPSLLLVADLGTLQGDGSPCVAGDPLTAACATWQDQSGQGHDAMQPTVMSRARVIAGAIGGRAAMVFDSVDDYYAIPGLMGAGDGIDHGAMICVSRPMADAGFQHGTNAVLRFGETSGWGSDFLAPLQDTLGARWGTGEPSNNITATRADAGSVWRVDAAVKAGHTEYLYSQGVAVGTFSGKWAPTAGAGGPCRLNEGESLGYGSTYYAREVGALLYAPGISVSDAEAMQARLRSYYGL